MQFTVSHKPLWQKFCTAFIAVFTVMTFTNPPATAEEVPSNHADVVTIFVDESGEIDTIQSNSQGTGFRNAGNRAPDCINAVSEWGFVQVYNNCPFDLRVKVVFAFAGDSACKLVVARTRTNIAPHRGRIDGVRVC